jgi:hypothetical protein
LFVKLQLVVSPINGTVVWIVGTVASVLEPSGAGSVTRIEVVFIVDVGTSGLGDTVVTKVEGEGVLEMITVVLDVPGVEVGTGSAEELTLPNSGMSCKSSASLIPDKSRQTALPSEPYVAVVVGALHDSDSVEEEVEVGVGVVVGSFDLSSGSVGFCSSSGLAVMTAPAATGIKAPPTEMKPPPGPPTTTAPTGTTTVAPPLTVVVGAADDVAVVSVNEVVIGLPDVTGSVVTPPGVVTLLVGVTGTPEDKGSVLVLGKVRKLADVFWKGAG